ncbi:hypothetical protein QOZ80_5BG0425310 [Eleusine coracana subsp. coracana]|nr:hypothetical protein QOZ80_5BG0425310 [Eleusine coracana subsp. coracana]
MPPDSKKRVARLLQLLKNKWRTSNAFRSLSRATKKNAANNSKDGDQESNGDTFVSANSSELRSISTDDGWTEPPSLRLNLPIIFPTGSLGRPPPASPVKIIKKLPFGYVIGRQPDTPVTQLPAMARSARKVMAALHLRSRSEMVKNKVARALKRMFRRARRGDAEQVDGGNCDDEDVFWKRNVRGLRCRRVEDDGDDPY